MRVAVMTDTMDRSAMGTAVYTKKLIDELIPLFKKEGAELTLVHSEKNDNPVYHEVREFILPHIRIPKLSKILSESWFLIKTRGQFDIIHYPQEANYPLFFLTDAKIAITMHSHLDGWRDYGLPIRYKQVYYTLKFFSWKIAAIFTPSESTKKGIVNIFKINPEKVHVFHLAADRTFMNAPEKKEAERDVIEVLPVTTPYMYAPGRSDPQKNIPRVVEAFGRAKKHANLPHMLLIGSKHRGDEDSRIEEIITREGLQKSVFFLPRVEQQLMPRLFAGADATIFPSLHEGFGLPILESMAAGTPVITSTTYSMPEVSGGAAILVDPKNIDSIADAIVRIGTDRLLREELSRKGRERAEGFSWNKVGVGVFSIYKRLCREEA